MSLEILFILKQNAIDYLDQEVTIPKVRSSGMDNWIKDIRMLERR